MILSLRPWEGQALFCVENTGEGIDPEDLPKLFNKFSKLESAGEEKGTGLGLAICRAIAEMHGGRVWAESEPGRMVRFYLLLPIPDLRETAAAAVRREMRAGRGGRFSVVLFHGLARPEEAAELLKGRLRSATALIAAEDGRILVILPNAGLKECAKAAAFIQKCLADIIGGGPMPEILSLVYPEDFRDEEEFLRRLEPPGK